MGGTHLIARSGRNSLARSGRSSLTRSGRSSFRTHQLGSRCLAANYNLVWVQTSSMHIHNDAILGILNGMFCYVIKSILGNINVNAIQGITATYILCCTPFISTHPRPTSTHPWPTSIHPCQHPLTHGT